MSRAKRMPSWCPACASGPLRRAGNRVICPNGCVADLRGWSYLALLTDEPPVVGDFLEKLDLAAYEMPVYLGLVVDATLTPLLAAVAQTPGQCLELLRLDWDLKKYEPVVVALYSCAGTAGRSAA